VAVVSHFLWFLYFILFIYLIIYLFIYSFEFFLKNRWQGGYFTVVAKEIAPWLGIWMVSKL
jgi:hypothetical protein